MSTSIGVIFANHFFQLFDQKNYKGLAKLLRAGSVVSFEGNNVKGVESIIKLFQAFNGKYPKTQHKQEADTLPAPVGNLVFITGRRLDKNHQTLPTGVLFVCTVVLKKDTSGHFVSNMIYRGEANGQNVPGTELKVGVTFAQQFYKAYDSNVKSLATIYTDNTFMKYEKDELKGAKMIMCKLTPGASEQIEKQHNMKLQFRSVRFKTVKHDIQQVDVHPLNKSILLSVAGRLAPDGSNQPVKFAEVFVLKNSGGVKVLVQGFRMIY